MAGGLVLATVGFALMTQVRAGSGLGYLVAAFVAYSLGIAPTFTLATDIIVGSGPAERAGVAAALSETGSELGGALGLAEHLSGDAGLALARDAQLAFTHALRLSGVISAVVMAGTAVLVAVPLRHRRPASSAH